MTIPASSHLGFIANGQSLDATRVNGELAWIESRAMDAGNTAGDTTQGPINYRVDTGTANTYVVTLVPALTSLVAGLEVTFKVANTNTGVSTLNVNGLGAANIVKYGNLPLVAGDLLVGAVVMVRYDGTTWQMISHPRTVPISRLLRYETHMFGFSDFRRVEENLAAGLISGVSGTASVAAISSQYGEFRLATGTTANSYASYIAQGSVAIPVSVPVGVVEAVVSGAIKSGMTGTTQKVWVFGFGSSTRASELNAANATNSGCFFRVEAAGSTVNIFAVSKDTTSETTTDTTVTDGSTKRRFEIVMTSTSARFYLDGILRATHTTNINTANKFIVLDLETLNTSTKESDVDWIRFQVPVTR